MNNINNNHQLAPGELAQHIGQLAPLDRQDQLAHIQEHIGNFQGIEIQLAPNDHEVIAHHIEAVQDHYEAALAAMARPNTAFDYAIFHALQHLNHTAEILTNHHEQQQQQEVVVPQHQVAEEGGDDHESLGSGDSQISDLTEPMDR